MRILRTTAVSGLVLILLAGALRADKDDQAARDERILREAGVDTDGSGLLAFFRKNTTTDADMASLEGHIKNLGADRFRVREQASAGLIAAGERAVALLRGAEKSPDPEVASRARRCLEQIKKGASEALLATAARLIALRRPDGTAKVLLDYVPFAEQESLAE